MTELSIGGTPASATEARTPAGIQMLAILQWRRLFVLTLIIATCALLAFGIYQGLGLDRGGSQPLETIIFVLSLAGLPWTVIGFWNAVIGFYLLHGHRDGLDAAAPFWRASDIAEPITLRTAVVMTVRNENPARAMERLHKVRDSLDGTGEGATFDYFVLSDTSDAAVAAQEEALRDAWNTRYGESARLTYRRREKNEAFKAGNIRDFLDSFSQPYDLMLTLDADSVMTGEAIVKLTRVMQAYPKLGIVQSLVVGTPSTSAFARMFQFGMRHGMRSYTMGSTWWTADCGPYWGHNALVRVQPFREACYLAPLPGNPPLGGHILSHDQIEAAMMRKAGYEVRVVPVEGGSYEDNPPTLLDFTKRDLRWCQGNMQYWRLLGLPGLLPLSRVQIALAIAMYIGAAAWTIIIALAALNVVIGGFKQVSAGIAITLFIVLYLMSLTPKLAGIADVLMTKGESARYGGTLRLLAGGFVEFLFSLLLAPAVTLRTTIFMVSLLFGRTVIWSGQERDTYGLSWETAARGMWPQLLVGWVLLIVVLVFVPKAFIFALPLIAGLLLAIPLAVFSASPTVGAAMTRIKLCGIPEEFEPVIEVKAAAPLPPAVEVKAAAPTPPAAEFKAATPTPPVAEVKAATPTPPAAEVKAAAPTQPVVELKPAAPTPPVAEVKAAAPTPPAVEVKPAAPTPPVAEVKAAAPTPPAVEVKAATPTPPAVGLGNKELVKVEPRETAIVPSAANVDAATPHPTAPVVTPAPVVPNAAGPDVRPQGSNGAATSFPTTRPTPERS